MYLTSVVSYFSYQHPLILLKQKNPIMLLNYLKIILNQLNFIFNSFHKIMAEIKTIDINTALKFFMFVFSHIL